MLLSQDSSNRFTLPTETLKKNLRTYLSQYKMIGDSIELKNAFFINISINFEIIVLPNFINSQVILECIQLLQSYFNRNRSSNCKKY